MSRQSQQQRRPDWEGPFRDCTEDGARPPGAWTRPWTRGSSTRTSGRHCGVPDPSDLSVTADAHSTPSPSLPQLLHGLPKLGRKGEEICSGRKSACFGVEGKCEMGSAGMSSNRTTATSLTVANILCVRWTRHGFFSDLP